MSAARRSRPAAGQARHRHGVPELRAVPASHGRRNVAFPLEMRNVARRRSTAASARHRPGRALATSSACRASSPAASSSAWRWRAPSSSTRACCCSTSRSARSTASCARPCSSRSSPAAQARTDHDLHHPRSGRGAGALRPHRGDGRGSIQQVATDDEIYERPANDFVADFVGESNIFTALECGRRGHAGERPPPEGRAAWRRSCTVGVLMRPERFSSGGANLFAGEVIEAVYLGTSSSCVLPARAAWSCSSASRQRARCRRRATGSTWVSSRTLSMFSNRRMLPFVVLSAARTSCACNRHEILRCAR